MKEYLKPAIEDLQSESVLFQAWKKTSAYIRSHNWYADTLELDWQALRIPEFISEIQKRLKQTGKWVPTPLRMIPAPKSQTWATEDGEWKPARERGKTSRPAVKIRPLAHVDLADQVVSTAVMLCIADRVETIQGNPTASINTKAERQRILSYGHRLFCDEESGQLCHRWGSQKLYRVFSTDYQRFLARPEQVAESVPARNGFEVAIVNADLSRFYDRVRPELLAASLGALRREASEDEFFSFTGSLFNWSWHEVRRAKAYGLEAGIEGFERVALPQGLVASGFLANIVLLQFDEKLSTHFGREIFPGQSITLIDACRYVDDLRLVLEVPKGIDEGIIEEQVAQCLNNLLDAEQTHLLVERKKTKAIVTGRQARFLVPQSRTAARIQSELSGGFDVQQGVQIINAIEGFFYAQRRYSTNIEEPQGGLPTILRGVSDLRDDTAARFAAGRFRKTFRSLRPLLEAEHLEAQPELLTSREQLDDRAYIFAAGLLEEWESNPAHLRLLRIGLDMCPRPDFLERILSRLRPAWQTGGLRGERREVMAYCLAELFRAGSTETGIVSDEDVLPTSANAERYHELLLKEAMAVFAAATGSSSSPQRFPWYLLQQVFLYLAVRKQPATAESGLVAVPGRTTILRRYCKLFRFFRDEEAESRSDSARFHLLLARCFGLEESTLQRLAITCDEALLEAIAAVSPSFAQAVWDLVATDRRGQLLAAARRLRLLPNVELQAVPARVSVGDLATQTPNIWHEESNLITLAVELLKARQGTPGGTLTPWRVFCELENVSTGPQKQRIRRNSVKIGDADGGEDFFATPKWFESDDERIRFEAGQVLRYCLTGNIEFLRPVPRARKTANVPRYRPATSHLEQSRYGSFHGRAAFGPDWLPISTWVETLLLELLRWPGCGQPESVRSLPALLDELSKRQKALEEQRGKATGVLFLEQEAPWPDKPPTGEWSRPLRIGIVQSVIPADDDFTLSDLRLNGTNIRRRHRLHLRTVLQGVRQMLRVRHTHRHTHRHNGSEHRPNLDWLIMPELAVHPDDIDTILLPFVRDYRCIMLVGIVYHPRDARPDSPLINSALWLIPEWRPDIGLQVRKVEQGKGYLAPKEHAEFSPAVQAFRPAQWIVRYRWHSSLDRKPLLLSASVCYDATDMALTSDLRNRNDLYAICALNSDVSTFDNLAESLNYHLFQGVMVVNNGCYGGSAFFAPLEKDFRRQVLHFHGQPQALIGFAEIDPQKFIDRPNDNESAWPTGKWKSPPAGWTGPHAP